MTRRALILVDVQQEYTDGALAIQHPPRDASGARILEAWDAADAAGVPVVVVQHELPEGAPVFAAGSPSWQLQPAIAERSAAAAKHVVKHYASVFAGTGLEQWLRENGIDTVTLVGYMTNNCVLGSAAAAEPLGFRVEVLSDATGAIHIANEAGTASARQVHETLMAVLHSNWAAVTTTGAWARAVAGGEEPAPDNLVASALAGRDAH